MKRQVSIGLGALAFAAVVGIAMFVRAPVNSLQAIEKAALERNIAELQRRIDFPALRSSLTAMMADAADAEFSKKDARMGGLARAVTGMVANMAVEAMLTPESVALMFRGRLAKPGASRQAEKQSGGTSREDVDFKTSWDDLSTVRVNVHPSGNPSKGLVLVMRRDGWDWRLVGVERGPLS